MDQLQSLMNNWILLAQGLIGSIGPLSDYNSHLTWLMSCRPLGEETGYR